ncbi:MAG: hypothetical protein H0W51_03520 [Euzebyales bacterium]|nr:hypothetical protein [Euzebyaceae bacterium]MBA3621378.1 hypothetical protein [Euzebyales bacterium]
MTPSSPPARRSWAGYGAGAALVLVGLGYLAFGVAGFTMPGLALSSAGAGGLMIGGVVSVAAGVLVWRGSRPVTLVALTILGGLFVAQVSLLILGESGDDEAVGRLLVTGVLAALLVLAALKSRRRP